MSFAQSRALADWFSRPPHSWTLDPIWFAADADNELVSYVEEVDERYTGWLAQQAQAGVTFAPAES